MEDANFNDPVASDSGSADIDEEALAMLMSFGYSSSHSMRALKETGSNVERYCIFAFSFSSMFFSNIFIN